MAIPTNALPESSGMLHGRCSQKGQRWIVRGSKKLHWAMSPNHGQSQPHLNKSPQSGVTAIRIPIKLIETAVRDCRDTADMYAMRVFNQCRQDDAQRHSNTRFAPACRRNFSIVGPACVEPGGPENMDRPKTKSPLKSGRSLIIIVLRYVINRIFDELRSITSQQWFL